MGLFDFLKTTVRDKKAPAKAGARKLPSNAIEFDSKSFPLAAITARGFVASQFDGSLIAGQNARITVKVDDQFGRFSFTTNVVISEVKDGKCVGGWMMLTPDLEAVIRKYSQNKKGTGK
ncbi:MAG TPA: hypothetical protein VD978_32645 [Azospirillum sp.]|nr:hypothetical protein [Azospirillum sp.]